MLPARGASPLPARHLCTSLIALAALTLAGCGRAPVTVAGQRGAAVLAAQADVAGIDEQIQKATIGRDEGGTQVRTLPRPQAPKPVTLLTYKALDNNLGMLVGEHLNTLERAGSSAGVNALALVDDIGPGNTRRYESMRKDADRKAVTSPFEAAGEANMGAGETLAGAVRWAFGAYPSRLRWLDINSHGGGFKGIAQDDP